MTVEPSAGRARRLSTPIELTAVAVFFFVVVSAYYRLRVGVNFDDEASRLGYLQHRQGLQDASAAQISLQRRMLEQK